MIRDALDLINRQKAEIERLKKNFYDKCLDSSVIYTIAKDKAIKDFAERLKGSLWKCSTLSDEDGEYDYVDIEELNILIDNLVKEMIGEQE